MDKADAKQSFLDQTRLGIAKPRTFGTQVNENKHGIDNPVIDLNTSSSLQGSFTSNLETPAGSINGSNTVFTLVHTPYPASGLHLYLNGIIQQSGGGDYTLSGATITFVTAPLTGSIMLASYTYSK